MKCVILAAGEGKRMGALTYSRPKVMLPLANKPILEWNLINAIDAGLEDFIFVVGYRSEKVRNYFGNGNKWGVKIDYVNQGKPIGTAHAIGIVQPFVDEFIVMCGDTIFGKEDIKKIINTKNSIGLTKVDDASEYGVVELDKKTVIKIHEKMIKPISNIINAGLYHFDKRIFEFINKTFRSPRGEYEITDSINMFLEKFDLKGILLKEWRDVVYPWHLLDANEDLLRRISKKINGDVENGAVLKNEVIIGKGTKVKNGSYIEGPVIIGKNCTIGPNCYIRPFTSIGDNCHIGNACEVKNSIIMDNTNIPHQNYVGDSIIGSNCNFGAGAKVANLRLDKKNIEVLLNGKILNTGRRKLGVIMGDDVQIGINAMINVGAILGNNVFVGPGAIVKGEIHSYSKIM